MATKKQRVKPEIEMVLNTGEPMEDVYRCPVCQRTGNLDNFDVIGADDGCVFCTRCHTELDMGD